MRGEFSPPQSEKSKERRGLRKKRGGGENSPISPPLDPRLPSVFRQLDDHVTSFRMFVRIPLLTSQP